MKASFSGRNGINIAMREKIKILNKIYLTYLSINMIQEYENLLRTIILNTLGNNDDINYKVSPERIAIWKVKRTEENQKFDGIPTETRLIYYSDFYDLKTIITKNWDKFLEFFFGDKKRFEVLFSEIEDFRNTISHGRQLLPYQNHLLEGIIGDLKTKIILHHNKNMNIDDHFIKILKVSDSLGNIWNESGFDDCLLPKNILTVGDVIEFIIDAYDPKGRTITYSISWGGTNLESKQNTFSITIQEGMIRKISGIDIIARTEDIGNKARVSFIYPAVLPRQ